MKVESIKAFGIKFASSMSVLFRSFFVLLDKCSISL